MIEKIEDEILSKNVYKVFLPWKLQQDIDYSSSKRLRYKGIITLRNTIDTTFLYQKAGEDEFIAYTVDRKRKRRKFLLHLIFSVKMCSKSRII